MIALHVHVVEMRHSCRDNTLLIYYCFDTEVLQMRSGIDTALHSVICTAMVWVGSLQKFVSYGLNITLLNRKKHHMVKFFPDANVYI